MSWPNALLRFAKSKRPSKHLQLFQSKIYCIKKILLKTNKDEPKMQEHVFFRKKNVNSKFDQKHTSLEFYCSTELIMFCYLTGPIQLSNETNNLYIPYVGTLGITFRSVFVKLLRFTAPFRT